MDIYEHTSAIDRWFSDLKLNTNAREIEELRMSFCAPMKNQGAGLLRNGHVAHLCGPHTQPTTAHSGFGVIHTQLMKKVHDSTYISEDDESMTDRYGSEHSLGFDLKHSLSVQNSTLETSTHDARTVLDGGLGYLGFRSERQVAKAEATATAAAEKARNDFDVSIRDLAVSLPIQMDSLEKPLFDVDIEMSEDETCSPSKPVKASFERCARQMIVPHAHNYELEVSRAQDLVTRPYYSRFDYMRNIPQQFFDVAATAWTDHKRRNLKRRREHNNREVLSEASFHSTSSLGYDANGLLVRHYAKKDSERILSSGCDYASEEPLTVDEVHARWEHHMCAVRGCPRPYANNMKCGFCEAHYKQYQRRRAPVRAKIAADRRQLFFVRCKLLHVERASGEAGRAMYEMAKAVR